MYHQASGISRCNCRSCESLKPFSGGASSSGSKAEAVEAFGGSGFVGTLTFEGEVQHLVTVVLKKDGWEY